MNSGLYSMKCVLPHPLRTLFYLQKFRKALTSNVKEQILLSCSILFF